MPTAAVYIINVEVVCNSVSTDSMMRRVLMNIHSINRGEEDNVEPISYKHHAVQGISWRVQTNIFCQSWLLSGRVADIAPWSCDCEFVPGQL